MFSKPNKITAQLTTFDIVFCKYLLSTKISHHQYPSKTRNGCFTSIKLHQSDLFVPLSNERKFWHCTTENLNFNVRLLLYANWNIQMNLPCLTGASSICHNRWANCKLYKLRSRNEMSVRLSCLRSVCVAKKFAMSKPNELHTVENQLVMQFHRTWTHADISIRKLRHSSM